MARLVLQMLLLFAVASVIFASRAGTSQKITIFASIEYFSRIRRLKFAIWYAANENTVTIHLSAWSKHGLSEHGVQKSVENANPEKWIQKQ